MNKTAHKIYIGLLLLTAITVTFFILADGINYYTTSLEERFYHSRHSDLKPSGILGHGYGIAGTLIMAVGVGVYMIRKRTKLFKFGYLKHWLEFHIFMCVLGPVLVLFHTAFKFGGIVAVSFWSMTAVVLSGLIGRFIYIQIPRSIQGQELSIKEISDIEHFYSSELEKKFPDAAVYILPVERYKEIPLNESFLFLLKDFFRVRNSLKKVKTVLKKNNVQKNEAGNIIRMLKNRMIIGRRIGMLKTMQNMFRYWHIIHLPFALIMFIIMVIHVIITVLFGYKWIF